MKERHIIGVFSLTIIASYTLGLYFSPFLRYLMYVGVLYPFVLIFNKNNSILIQSKNFNYLVPFLLLVVFGIFHFKNVFNVSQTTFIQIFILLSYTVPFLFIKRIDFPLKTINLALIIFYFITVGYQIHVSLSLDTLLGSNTSTGETNQHPFIFGLFFLYHLKKRNKLFLALNAVFLLLSFKRIVVLSVIASLFFYFTIDSKKSKKIIPKLAFIVNSLLILFSYQLANGFFDPYITKYLGVSPGFFTMGRIGLWQTAIKGVSTHQSLATTFFFGSGLGATFDYLSNTQGDILHNDLLKIYLEYGYIVLSFFIYYLYKNIRNTYLVIYINILFLTDNVLMYSMVMFHYFLILISLESDHEL